MGSVLVAKGDEILFEQGYGMANLELNVANTPQTVFRIGSITKAFTAALILNLQEEDKLNVNDALSKYLPDFPHAADITLQQLLNHTAGVYDYAESNPDLPKLAREHLTLDELIATFKDEPLTFEPGTKWSYSNSGYVLLTKVIEIVSGMPYGEYLEQALVKPLGLTATGVEDARVITPNRAAGYEQTPDGLLNARPIDPSIPSGAGALVSTAPDLYIWDRALMTGKVLSEDSRQAMFAKTVNTEQPGMTSYYGDGWMMGERFGRQVIDHGGGIFGFSAMNAFYPKDEVVVVVLSNVEDFPSAQIAIDLAAIAFGKPYTLPTKNVAVQVDSRILEQYVGSYQLAPDFSLDITLEDGHLYAQPPGEDKLEIFPKSEAGFFLPAADVELTFTKNAEGVVDGLVFHQNGQDIPGKRISSGPNP
jgi:CubicO group peptidase (beta-lactamase class C family)